MTSIYRTTETKIANITDAYAMDTEANMYFINGYELTDEQIERLESLLEDCEHVIESMDGDTYYGFDDEYIVIDWYGEDI